MTRSTSALNFTTLSRCATPKLPSNKLEALFCWRKRLVRARMLWVRTFSLAFSPRIECGGFCGGGGGGGCARARVVVYAMKPRPVICKRMDVRYHCSQ